MWEKWHWQHVLIFRILTFSSQLRFHYVYLYRCSICLGEYQDKEILRIMPVCCHNFHVSCIDTWLQQQSTCPVCRLPLRDSVEAKHMISSMFSAILESRDSAEDESERSYQWLLPNQVHSSDAESNQEHRVSVPRNLEPTHAQEAEAGR
eukprot:TRINITY_DN11802_c2_g2_i2.p1 TRINITY_DN11802_c2_g2~~TRINITY_DN11802_c2_g2_i2.p1  ORF type:complete len:149 (-),score=13.39 TRINITY_DN11802_c2_g2_i2:488-934(-)